MNVAQPMLSLPDRVTVCEVGPRDGLQMEKNQLSLEQKVELIEKAAEAGARIIEIGSFVHPKAVPQMADTDEVAKRIRRRDGVEYRALVMNLKGVRRALDAGVTKVKLTSSASREHSLKNMKRTPEEVVRGFAECVQFASEHEMDISGAISTAFGCSLEGHVPLERVEVLTDEYLKLGVTELSMSDTTGMANPRQIFLHMSRMRTRYPQVRWVVHLHNTRGMALANILAAMQAGVTVFDACLAGLGGCPFAPGASGNVAMEDVLFMLRQMGVATEYNFDAALKLAAEVRDWIGHADSMMLRLGHFHMENTKCPSAVSCN